MGLCGIVGVSGLVMGVHFGIYGLGMWLTVARKLVAVCLFGVLVH